jgi:hypothetical protein
MYWWIIRRCALPVLIQVFVGQALLEPGRAQQLEVRKSKEAKEYERQEKSRRAELIRLNGAGSDPLLASKLLSMRMSDQKIRREIFGHAEADQSRLSPELEKTDSFLTEQLKEIISAQGWPTIALVGMEASEAAALVLIHSPDHIFQQRMLPTLGQLVQEKKIVGTDIALLTDKILVSEGKLQRFGTQFSWVDNGSMVMNPVEDPVHLDERRNTYCLPPMDLYKRELSLTYHHIVK